MTAALLLPDHGALSTDFKNSASAPDQGHRFSGRLFNLSGHTVRFRAVVSLLAVFDLNRHGKTISDPFQASTDSKQNHASQEGTPASSFNKYHFTPTVGQMHVHRALRGPHPIVFRVILLFRIKAFGKGGAVRGNTDVAPVDNFMLPLDS